MVKTAKKIFLAVIMACLMCLVSTPCPVSATAADSSASDIGQVYVADMSNIELLDESVMTREEAIQMLNLSDEEANQVTIYTCTVGSDDSSSPTGRSIEELNYGDVKYYDLTFHKYNRGLDRKFNGNKMKWAAQLLSTNGSGVDVIRCSYDVPSGYETMELSPGYYDTLTTSWFNIYYGGTYYWKYYGFGGTADNPAEHTVRLIIGIL